MDTIPPSSSISNVQAIATPTLSQELKTALSTFHFYYPSATLVAELVTTHHEQYIVRATASLHGQAIGSAMATATHIERAEDRAKHRAILALLAQHHPEVSSLPASQTENSYSSPLPFAPPQPTQSVIGHIPLSGAQQSFETPTSIQSNTQPENQQPDKLSPPHPSSLTPHSGSSADVTPTPVFTPSSPATEEFQASSVPLASVTSLPQPGRSDAMDSTSAPPLDMTDDSDKPIDLIQEDEMPKMNLADDDLSDLVIPTIESSSKTDPKTTSNPAPAASRAKSKKRSSTPKISTPPSEAPTAAPSSPPSASLSLDLSDIIAKTSVELKRLGWTNSQGRDHLQQVYGKRSRQQLTDPELIDFLKYLELQPSPTSRPNE